MEYLSRDDRTFASVLICTHNRSALLAEALDSLSRIRSTFPWEVVLVDNGSTDDTAAVVARYAAAFPVKLRYIAEPRIGKSIALNTGIVHAAGDVIVFGDDDQHFAEDWIDRSCAPLVENPEIDYTGGPVFPMAGVKLPEWVDLTRAEYRSPLGVFDHGAEPFIFEDRRRVAGGGNMAVRRSLLERIGGFREDLGRKGRSLLGQEQAEFFSRSRAAGARGAFVPDMTVWHHVPQERLHRRYFFRWWFWKGIGSARWHALAGRTEYGLDLATVPRVMWVPRFVFGESIRALGAAITTHIRRDAPPTRLLPVLRLAYLAGYASEARRWPAVNAPATMSDLRPTGES